MGGSTVRVPESILVIGVGNRWRRDDGAGLVVAKAIRARALANATVQLCETNPLALLDHDLDGRRLILIDAVQAPRGPCRVHLLEGADRSLRREFPTSSHGFGLAETLELASRLGCWPDDTVVYGVEGWDFSHGQGLSTEAAIAARECARLVANDIASRESRSTARRRTCGFRS